MKRFRQFVSLMVLGVLLLGLSGCVRYDLGIRYVSQTRGEIVQHIRLGESVTQFNGAIARDWLRALDQRTRAVGGKTQRTSAQDITLRIPFYNGADLETKFNRFFQPDESAADAPANQGEDTPLPKIQAHLSVQEQNFLLVQRNRLVYDLDVRSLALRSPEGTVVVGPGALLDLDFSLDTPWGAKTLPTSLPARGSQQAQHLMWRLSPTDPTHIEVSFWVPSPLGIGTVVIILLMGLGAGLKSMLPKPSD